MASSKKARHIVEHQAVLPIRSRKDAGHAHGAKDAQAGQLIVVVHLALGNTYIGPFERSLSDASGNSPDEPKFGFAQPRTTALVSMADLVNDKLGTPGTSEPAGVTQWVQGTARKRD